MVLDKESLRYLLDNPILDQLRFFFKTLFSVVDVSVLGFKSVKSVAAHRHRTSSDNLGCGIEHRHCVLPAVGLLVHPNLLSDRDGIFI